MYRIYFFFLGDEGQNLFHLDGSARDVGEFRSVARKTGQVVLTAVSFLPEDGSDPLDLTPLFTEGL